jgi:F0F1-type ATP synthase membrane subunit b/b'
VRRSTRSRKPAGTPPWKSAIGFSRKLESKPTKDSGRRAARSQANERLRQARSEIAAEVEQARRGLDAESERLAEEIARALLTPTGRKAGKTQ